MLGNMAIDIDGDSDAEAKVGDVIQDVDTQISAIYSLLEGIETDIAMHKWFNS